MPISYVIQGILIGLAVAVPVGPLGLLCINRSLMLGALAGLASGLGVASADALVAGIAALGISLVSDFLIEQQFLLRLIGGIFLCVLGYRIYRIEPAVKVPTISTNGLLGAYATTFFLTVSNPVTILSFIAIYAGWHVPSLRGHYPAAALLMAGVFIGSALWWVALFAGLTLFRLNISNGFLAMVHRVTGIMIVGFGVVVLLSLSPLKHAVNFTF
ncbi:MAG: LysE family translocator [Candidatus Binatia bacterium]